MNSKLRSLLVGVGIFVVGGVSFSVFRREPPGQSIANLRDAGLLSERTGRFVLACPEKITTATRNNLRKNGYGTFRPGTVHRIARVVIEHQNIEALWLPDGGRIDEQNDSGVPIDCWALARNDFFGWAPVLDGGHCLKRELVNPSIDVLAAEEVDGGDEEDETDDSLQFRTDDCFRLECNDDTDAGIRELNWLADGGARHAFPDGGPRPWCNVATRRGRITPPCVIPDCSLSDGGWDDNGPEVDCRGTGPFGISDGGPRWRGCNVTPATFATGSACIPVECSVVSGDGIDVLR